MKIMIPRLVLIRGGGDLASGVAHRLWNSGFDTVILEIEKPLVVRRTVSFASAVYKKSIEVESVRAEFCPSAEQADRFIARGIIPVLIDPQAKTLNLLKPAVLVDAIMAKKEILTKISDAELVIGLGPGFTAGRDAHAVIETKRGHNLGKVIYSGSAAEDTAEPGKIAGYGKERLLRAPVSGLFKPSKKIGDTVEAGEVVAFINNTPIKAQISGMIRGMLYPGLEVVEDTKIGDIDPRGAAVDCYAISDKARAIGGGVLEAIMRRYNYDRPQTSG